MLLHAVLLAGWLFAQGSPIVPPAPVTTHSEVSVTVQAPPADPKVTATNAVEGSESVFMNVIVPPPVWVANQFMGLPNFWTQTPDEWSWNNPALRDLAKSFTAVAAALMGLAIFAAGLRHSLTHDASYGRLALGLVAALGDLVWWQWGVQINNALCAVVSGSGANLSDIVKPMLQFTPPEPGLLDVQTLATGGLVLLAAVVAIIVSFALFMRLALIAVLLVVGPLLLVTGATEDSSFMAQHYWKLSVAVLFSQVVIVVGFRVTAVLSAMGGAGAIATLLAIGVLWVIKDLPKTLIAGYAGGAGNGGRGIGVGALLLARKLIARF